MEFKHLLRTQETGAVNVMSDEASCEREVYISADVRY